MNLSLPQPDPFSVFKVLYNHASEDGREEKLFGDNREKLFAAFEKMPYGKTMPGVYLEIPLSGTPFCDLICKLNQIPELSTLDPDQGYGLNKTLAWRRNMKNPKGFFCIEADVSSQNGLPAAPVWECSFAPEEAGAFLQTLNAADRLSDYLDFLERMPSSWTPYYLGLYPDRKDVPLRIGVLFTEEEKKNVYRNPKLLEEHLQQAGFTATNDSMLTQLSEMIKPGMPAEVQFDLFPDKTVGKALGTIITVFVGLSHFRREEYLKTDKAAAVMEELETQGMIDDRWKLFRDCYFAKKIPVIFDDGTENNFLMFSFLHSVKVKYIDGNPCSKCYLSMGAGYL